MSWTEREWDRVMCGQENHTAGIRKAKNTFALLLPKFHQFLVKFLLGTVFQTKNVNFIAKSFQKVIAFRMASVLCRDACGEGFLLSC